MRVLRAEEPPPGWEEDYARDGFYVIEEALTDEAQEAVVREIMEEPRTTDLLARHRAGGEGAPSEMTLRPWDTMCDRPGETVQDGLLDAPLVQSMLRHAMGGPRYTFCHSGFSVRCPGNAGTGMHQDFAYGPAPYSLPEHSPASDLSVVQILYYPTGFKTGDNHLRVMPGSHKISAFEPELEGPGLERGGDHETTLKDSFGLSAKELSLPPGSMVFLNGRCFHGVWPKPVDSPEAARLFVFYVYKNAGVHRHTQPIPRHWLPPASDRSDWSQHRRMLLDRETNWAEQAVSRTWEDKWNPAFVGLGPATAAGEEAKL